jgi:poly-beta-1,6-N-acetyl-D-glucosamine biosynthesis protein PgaD
MKPDWPPLITDAERPRWVVRRDRFLTVLVWVLFLVLFIEQYWAFHTRVATYFTDPAAEWEFLLGPFFAVAALMLISLGASAIGTYRRALRARSRPEPPPLPLEAEAVHLGVTPAELAAARQHQIMAVAIETDGRFQFTYTEPAAGKDPSAPPAPGPSIPGR